MTQSEEIPSQFTAIDPNDYAKITEESFVKKYGKAAQNLIDQIRSQAISSAKEERMFDDQELEYIYKYLDVDASYYLFLGIERKIRKVLEPYKTIDLKRSKKV